MRIAIGIEYDGTSYHGWQHQENLLTVQNTIEKALSSIAAHPVALICAGRTDAGVHAEMQVAHFDTNSSRPMHAFTFGGNSLLPKDIAIHWAKEVTNDFHARFSAIARTYTYYIFNSPTNPAISRNHVSWYPYHKLDADKMREGASFLIGEHDFCSYRGSGCQAKTTTRFVEYINVLQTGEVITIHIKANAFLQHMVRNIAGVLIEIGAEMRKPEWSKEVLDARDRKAGGITAHPQGLFLTQVHYPEKFNI